MGTYVSQNNLINWGQSFLERIKFVFVYIVRIYSLLDNTEYLFSGDQPIIWPQRIVVICRATRKICFLATCRHRTTVTFFPDDAGLSYGSQNKCSFAETEWESIPILLKGGGGQIGECETEILEINWLGLCYTPSERSKHWRILRGSSSLRFLVDRKTTGLNDSFSVIIMHFWRSFERKTKAHHFSGLFVKWHQSLACTFAPNSVKEISVIKCCY